LSKAKDLEITVLLGDPNLEDRVKLNNRFNEQDLETVRILKSALSSLRKFSFNFLNNHKTLINDLITSSPKFVLNLCDEGYLNDPFKEPHVAALLELLDIPFSGSNSRSLSICYNKLIVTSLARAINIPTPFELCLNSLKSTKISNFVFPAILKPKFGDNSVGITAKSIVNNEIELNSQLENLRSLLPNQDFLIQEYLEGSEYSVGIIGNSPKDFKVLPILEVDYSALPPNLPHILGYESKMIPDSIYWQRIGYRPAHFASEALKDFLIDCSLQLFKELKCRDYARFDFRLNKSQEPKLLEVNPNPGWCHDGKMNIMANWAGIDYSSLLNTIIEAALTRYG
jgi:D-alanine-D-alanine ligase